MCPRRANGHAWQLARERSTRDCEADVCQTCGLVRMTCQAPGRTDAGLAVQEPPDSASYCLLPPDRTFARPLGERAENRLLPQRAECKQLEATILSMHTEAAGP